MLTCIIEVVCYQKFHRRISFKILTTAVSSVWPRGFGYFSNHFIFAWCIHKIEMLLMIVCEGDRSGEYAVTMNTVLLEVISGDLSLFMRLFLSAQPINPYCHWSIINWTGINWEFLMYVDFLVCFLMLVLITLSLVVAILLWKLELCQSLQKLSTDTTPSQNEKEKNNFMLDNLMFALVLLYCIPMLNDCRIEATCDDWWVRRAVHQPLGETMMNQ